ncbi:MAG: prepilin-type N-terminal cleavage/methylation domain-containing protein [Candidatus Gracilibacteria bacterium]|nr:prepilin-type N-terminal cleavage/methylation domain-containing protein [Candidatus Gracilibacteria bacterium]
MFNQKNQGFTLIELIVTIVIVLILGTIAFISFQGYSKNARDSKRIADINHVEKSLGLYVVKTGFYPIPDRSKNITYGGGTAWIEGTIGDTVIKNIDKVSKKPIDPLTDNEYTYSITPSRTEYQIGAISEGSLTFDFKLNKTYAADLSKARAYIKGNYNEKITRVKYTNSDSLLAMPSIIVTDITDPKLETILPKKILVFNNYGNIPHSYNPMGTMTGEVEYNPSNLVVYNGTSIDLSKDEDKITFLSNLQNAYSGSFLSSEPAYSDIIDVDIVNNPNIAISLVNNFVDNNIGGIVGTQSNIVYKTCSLDGQTIAHDQKITAYSENSILLGASYDCVDISLERTCSDGLLSGDDSFKYASCAKGVASNCSANSSYVFNGHTYNIPAINHGTSTGNIISTNVSGTNGIYTYTLTSVSCNDGVLINPIENSTPTIVSCNTGYTPSGSTCIPLTYTVSGSFGSNASGALINVCGTYVTANSSGNFSATRNYGSTCNTISATRSGYSCTTTTQGPVSLTSNVTTIAGSCTLLNPYASCTSAGQVTSSTTKYPGISVGGTRPAHGACNTYDIIVCTGVGGGYTMSACNIGATAAGTTSASYGYYFQWGRNKGFTGTTSAYTPQQSSTIAGTVGLDASTDTYGFVRNTGYQTWANTTITTNWGNNGTVLEKQGPCADGYHVPNLYEWHGVVYAGGYYGWYSTQQGDSMSYSLKLPLAGYRDGGDGAMHYAGTYGEYWLSMQSTSNTALSYSIHFNNSIIYDTYSTYRARGFPVRCFKNP